MRGAFVASLGALDDEYRERVERARQSGKVLRYVAKIRSRAISRRHRGRSRELRRSRICAAPTIRWRSTRSATRPIRSSSPVPAPARKSPRPECSTTSWPSPWRNGGGVRDEGNRVSLPARSATSVPASTSSGSPSKGSAIASRVELTDGDARDRCDHRQSTPRSCRSIRCATPPRSQRSHGFARMATRAIRSSRSTKGLPLSGGLGGSAASSVAGAFAAALAMGSGTTPIELAAAALQGEMTVAGEHLDNIAPSILGGLALSRSVRPIDIVALTVQPTGASRSSRPTFASRRRRRARCCRRRPAARCGCSRWRTPPASCMPSRPATANCYAARSTIATPNRAAPHSSRTSTR